MRIDNVVKTDVLHSDIDKIENDLLFHDYTCDIKFPHLHVRLISILKKKKQGCYDNRSCSSSSKEKQQLVVPENR